MPDALPTLRVIFTQGPEDLIAAGIVEDVDMFRDAHFKSMEEMLKYLGKRYAAQFHIVCIESRPVKRGPKP